MRVQIDPSLFEARNAFRQLDKIFGYFEDDQHQWDVGPDDSVFGSAWLQEQSRTTATIREWLEKLYTHGGWTEPHTLVLFVAPGEAKLDRAGQTVGVDHVHRVLARPAYVVVENEFSDGRFLTCVLRAYGAWDRLANLFEHRRVEWKHAGGSGEMKPIIEQLLADEAVVPQRIMVLRDSDRDSTGIPPAKQTEINRLREICDPALIRLHVLHKRDSENYLPMRLLPKKKLQLPMKDGRRYDELDQDARDVVDMKQRFGKEIGKRFCETIHREEFEAVCQTCPRELPALIQKVLDLR